VALAVAVLAVTGLVVALLVVTGCAGVQTEDASRGTPSSTLPTRGVPAVPVVAVFGDSTALMTSWGLRTEAVRTSRLAYAEGFTGLGCSVLRTAVRKIADDVSPVDPTCNDWHDIWRTTIDTSDPDVVVVQTGSWDVADRMLAGEDGWRSPGDVIFDAFAMSEMLAAVDLLSARGAAVVWLTSPVPGAAAYADPKVRAFDPAPRHQALNRLIRQLADQRPGVVTVVDLADWIAGVDPQEDARLRPDGIHFAYDTSGEVCDRYLCEEILRAVREQRAGVAPSSTSVATPFAVVPGPEVPDGRAQAVALLRGRTLHDAGLAAANAGWRVRVDSDQEFDRVPAAPDELMLWAWAGPVSDAR
jgi:hypothetical protein